ncbi:phosphatase PAP2 family protein [Deinococcus sp.]|uniref:phosphatase PAP2 family protein n=1 Tax=Deinococcus sp. TaxID=47478 RepID=UPI0025C2BAC1|nr:phosphatase PAP2 family protein [Deinococcus sp.]
MFPHSRREFLPFLRSHWRPLLKVLLGVLIPFVLFAHLTHEVFREGGFWWDQRLLDWYAQRRTPALTRVAETLATLGGVVVLPLVTGLLAWVLARLGGAVGRAYGWFLVSGVAGAALLNVVAKLVFHRPRPDELMAVLRETGFSFPSGHAMANAAFGFALTLVFWRSRAAWPVAVFGLLWALAVGVSRNYLGVHYPSDVLAGFTASVAWVAGLYMVMAQRWPHLRGSHAGVKDTR